MIGKVRLPGRNGKPRESSLSFLKESFMKNLLFFFLITLCLSIAVVAQSVMLGSFTAGQAGQKVIEKAFTRNEVVEFTEIKVSQKAVTPGKPFEDRKSVV